ncbi:MAG: phage Gp37/Gp68 family protein [Opitutaceae bacterium]|nr:phage Gp37/Gp68 family protein [Opitutaceae bacterium]
MAENSKIEWTDHTFNPWIGCTKVSPGCANCYAETLMDTRYKRVKWGKGQPRVRTSAANWNLPLKWDREAAAIRDALNAGGKFGASRPRVFCASLADWLDDEVPIEWLVDLLDLIRRTPNLDWLLLTKRPENFEKRIKEAGDYVRCLDRTSIIYAAIADNLDAWAIGFRIPANVWIGTTVEDQPRADERRNALRDIPARVRFVSHEPSLEVVDWTGWEFADWFTSGGESGHGARPSNPAAHRAVRDFCAQHKKAYHFKQWGDWGRRGENGITLDDAGRLDRMGFWRDGREWNTGFTSGGDEHMVRVGKARAGRLLDGREHNEFPQPLGKTP